MDDGTLTLHVADKSTAQHERGPRCTLLRKSTSMPIRVHQHPIAKHLRHLVTLRDSVIFELARRRLSDKVHIPNTNPDVDATMNHLTVSNESPSVAHSLSSPNTILPFSRVN